MDINDTVKDLKDNVSAVRDIDISHDELGVVNGFHEAQSAKESIESYLETILDQLEKYIDKLNWHFVEEKLKVIDNWAKQIRQQSQKIDKLAESGVHEANFPRQRLQLIKSVVENERTIKKDLYQLEIDLKLCELRSDFSRFESLESTKENIEKIAKDSELAFRDIEKVLNASRDMMIGEGIDDSQAQFSDLKSHHRDHEWFWFFATVVSAIFLVLSVSYAVWGMSDPIPIDDETRLIIIEALKRVLLISVTGVFLRICLVKYDAERGLRIIYEHRQKVLEHYRSFEAGIGDDLEAKNQFRLEIAKYIFSDPKSVYSDSSDTRRADININPIVSGAERVIRGG